MKRNRFLNLVTGTFFAATALFAFTACSGDTNEDNGINTEKQKAVKNYTISLGVTVNGTTNYYIVSAKDLMTGTISAKGQGIEQNNYHDYVGAGKTFFSIGGMGVTEVTAFRNNADGQLAQAGLFDLNATPDEFIMLDNNTMLGIDVPSEGAGDKIKFFTVDINNAKILTSNSENTVAPLNNKAWPSITGMAVAGGKVYVAYVPMDKSYLTPATDECYVAVYSYPSFKFEKLMTDSRTGNAGSWNAYNAFVKTEDGDLYVMSNSAIHNGFSQGTKNAAFLKIKSGATEFSENYYFDFEKLTKGLKPAHLIYIGNDKVYAEVSTISPQTLEGRWRDKSVKCCIIDLKNQTVKDITEIPVHNGDGGRRFNAICDGNYVYHGVNTADGFYIYRTDIKTGTAVRGAKVETTFIAGLHRLQ